MTDVVDIPDNGSDVEIQEDRNSAPHPSTLAFDELRNLKREMEMRGNQLGKTWSELSRLMTKYQAQLIEKHEQYESSISAEEHGRLTQLESIIDKNRLENQRLSKSVSDLEQKLLDKDTEIVRLRTEVHKSRNEVSMKDSLIQKLQNQMAQEAMEYQTEINSLKEILEIEKSQNDGANVELSAKRRRLVMPSQASHRQFVSRENSLIKSEPGLQSCKQQTVFSAPRSTQLSHTQTSDSTLEPGYSDAADDLAASTSMAPDDIMHESGDAAYYKQAGGYENDDESNSGDVMSDLLEQKHMIDSNASQVEPQLMIPNVHGAQQSTPQNDGEQTSDETIVWHYNRFRPKIQCPICRKHIHGASFARHKRRHLDIRPFQCMICAESFATISCCESHIRRLHDRKDRPRDFVKRDEHLRANFSPTSPDPEPE